MTDPVPGTWTSLDPNEDVPIKAGYFYSAVVLVANSITTDKIKSVFADHGLETKNFQDPAAYDPPADSGMRYVAAITYAPKDGGTIPTHAPWGAGWLVGGTHAVKIWVAPGQPGLAPAPPPVPKPFPWLPVLGGLALAGGLGYYTWRRRVKARRLSA